MAESTEVDGSPFSPDRHRLPEVRVELWNGFVFVNLDPDAEALGPRLAGLDDIVSRFDMGSYVTVRDEVDVWPTNWKLLVENFMDAYHVFKVHKESFGASGDSTGATEMYPGTFAGPIIASSRPMALTSPLMAMTVSTASGVARSCLRPSFPVS